MVRILAVTRHFVLVLAALHGLSASSAQAAGDPEKGASTFRRCATCHSVQAGSPSKIGPNLFGVIGRKAASLSDYMYSMAMEAAGFVWTEDTMISFLQRPKQMLPGTKMPFSGLTNIDDAANIVAYLKSLK
jgi:cytochrome c